MSVIDFHILVMENTNNNENKEKSFNHYIYILISVVEWTNLK